MDRFNPVKTEIRKMRRIIDNFSIGAMEIENVRSPYDEGPELQSVNLLRSKSVYLDVMRGLHDPVNKSDTSTVKHVRKELLEMCDRSIVEDKAVNAGIVAEHVNDIIRRPASDEGKQQVLQKLHNIQRLVNEHDHLISSIMRLKSIRMGLEMELKDEWQKTIEFIDELKYSQKVPNPEIMMLERQIGKINQMGRLINTLLIGLGAELGGRWNDVFCDVRTPLKLVDFLNE